MFLECPTICSNIEVFNEVCGNSVLYFDPYDSENLANCIDMVFESNSLKEKLKVDGKNRAELFKWEKCAKETTDIYKKLI